MFSFLGLIVDLLLNIITLGWWGHNIGSDKVYTTGDNFARPDYTGSLTDFVDKHQI